VGISDESLTLELDDNRVISVPTPWFPLLADANASQRSHYELVDGGRAIHWPEIDEDISIAGLLGAAD